MLGKVCPIVNEIQQNTHKEVCLFNIKIKTDSNKHQF
jgi:hypothetical protein